MSDPQQSQQRLQQFLQLLPVTQAIAGLPLGEHGKYYNDDQMELRAQALRRAFKHAKALAREIASAE
jgi:hypothetical protein